MGVSRGAVWDTAGRPRHCGTGPQAGPRCWEAHVRNRRSAATCSTCVPLGGPAEGPCSQPLSPSWVSGRTPRHHRFGSLPVPSLSCFGASPPPNRCPLAVAPTDFCCLRQVPAAVPGGDQGEATLACHGGAAGTRWPVRASIPPRALHVLECEGPAHQHRSVPRALAVAWGGAGSPAGRRKPAGLWLFSPVCLALYWVASWCLSLFIQNKAEAKRSKIN